MKVVWGCALTILVFCFIPRSGQAKQEWEDSSHDPWASVREELAQQEATLRELEEPTPVPPELPARVRSSHREPVWKRNFARGPIDLVAQAKVAALETVTLKTRPGQLYGDVRSMMTHMFVRCRLTGMHPGSLKMRCMTRAGTLSHSPQFQVDDLTIGPTGEFTIKKDKLQVQGAIQSTKEGVELVLSSLRFTYSHASDNGPLQERIKLREPVRSAFTQVTQ